MAGRVESVPDLLVTLARDMDRLGPVGSAAVSAAFMTAGRWRVSVRVEGARGSMAWAPRFRDGKDAAEYRAGALELLGRFI